MASRLDLDKLDGAALAGLAHRALTLGLQDAAAGAPCGRHASAIMVALAPYGGRWRAHHREALHAAYRAGFDIARVRRSPLRT